MTVSVSEVEESKHQRRCFMPNVILYICLVGVCKMEIGVVLGTLASLFHHHVHSPHPLSQHVFYNEYLYE